MSQATNLTVNFFTRDHLAQIMAKNGRSEERRVGKECTSVCVDLGGRRIIQAEDGIRDVIVCDWSSDVCSSDLVKLIDVKGHSVAVINVQGRVFMKEHLDCPFKTVDSILTYLRDKTKTIIVDFHAETTAEKASLAYYLDGRVSALVGTHTHVQTADERVLPAGTAFITDLGMCGALDSSLGMKLDSIIQHFITQMPTRFTVETNGPVLLNGVWIEIDTTTGKALKIERIRIVDEELQIDEKE